MTDVRNCLERFVHLRTSYSFSVLLIIPGVLCVHSYKTLCCNFDVPSLSIHTQNTDAHHEQMQLAFKFNSFWGLGNCVYENV